MSEKFKDSGEIDEIIAEVNKLKEEKERALNGKSAESAVNSIVEKNNLSEAESDKSQMADMIASSLNDKHSDTASESEEKKKPEEKKEEPEAKENKAPKKQKKKKKKKRTAVLFVLGLLIILLGGAYIIGLMMTNDKFLPNTYINGVNVSGMTAEQAVETIEELGNQLDKIVFLKNDGSSVTIPYERFGYEFNTEEVVDEAISGTNEYLYFLHFFKTTEITDEMVGSYDESELEEEINNASFGTKEPTNAKIVQGDDGKFTISAEKEGTVVETDKVLAAAIEAIDAGVEEVDLEAEGCYKQPEITSEDLEDKLEELNKIFDVVIELDFDYTTEKISYDTIEDAFTFEDDGTYAIDQEIVWEWVETLRDKYDTLHKTRKFTATLQGEITIDSQEDYYGKKDAIFGYMMDSDETAAAIVEAFMAGESTTIEPVYYHNGGYYYDTMGQVEHDESDEADVITDISRIDSYIEVDLTNQELWYYEDGELVFECGVVSGLPTAERMTYPGIYQLWYKETDKTMTGETTEGEYESTCSFWNYISVRSIGIHDAVWQSSFGGDRYTWAGSHGCVGVSYDSAKFIYESVPLGTVVIMYY
ncbi:MAG: L,D-transpeptidase/peptidoglycan binding protein [Ruminococcus sp.]|nr:L,D-transpeptidase/peptidoglycan binding protein [Ruminococcus sp.]